MQRVIQHPSNGCIWTVSEEFIQMIDDGEVEEAEGHTKACGPVAGRYPGVFWYNNVMAIHVMERKDDGSEILRRYLEKFSINEDRYGRIDVPEENGEEKEKKTLQEHPA